MWEDENLSTLAVVSGSGHVPDALSGCSTAQFARPLIRMDIGDDDDEEDDDEEEEEDKNLARAVPQLASDIPPLSRSWPAQAP